MDAFKNNTIGSSFQTLLPEAKGALEKILSDKNFLTAIKEKYSDGFPSQVTIITGPSRTADIEKTLVMGAHGPKELYVFMIDDL